MAWERWQSLSPEEKERYKKQARGYVDRGEPLTVAAIREVIDGYPGLFRQVRTYQPARTGEALTRPDHDLVVRVRGTGRRRLLLLGHVDTVHAEFDPPQVGRVDIRSGKLDGSLKAAEELLRAEGFTEIRYFRTQPSTYDDATTRGDIDFDREGRTVATSSVDGTVRVWDAATGRLRTSSRH